MWQDKSTLEHNLDVHSSYIPICNLPDYDTHTISGHMSLTSFLYTNTKMFLFKSHSVGEGVAEAGSRVNEESA